MLVNLFIIKFVLEVRHFFGNGCIGFYSDTFLILSMICWISMNDLRLGTDYTDSENFSSILSLTLAAFSCLFVPLNFVFHFYKLNPFKDYKKINKEKITNSDAKSYEAEL